MILHRMDMRISGNAFVLIIPSDAFKREFREINRNENRLYSFIFTPHKPHTAIYKKV
jgi:gluconate kinase